MKTLHDILELITELNIILEYQALPNHMLGIYHGDSNMDFIILNQDITDDEIQHRIILAEELGHYFTTIGNNTPRKYTKYADKLKVDKCEEKALRWSLNYLVPTQALIEVLQANKHMTIDECCDYFQVTEDFMIRKFEMMAKEKIYWSLGDDLYLVLSGLPGVYITKLYV